jgi:hypothetical protein
MKELEVSDNYCAWVMNDVMSEAEAGGERDGTSSWFESRWLRRFQAWLLEPVPFPGLHWFGNGFPQQRHVAGSPMGHCSAFHNPSPWCRVILVAGVLAAPGAFAGMIASLFLGEPIVCVVAGVLVGAGFGAVMEAWPLPDSGDAVHHDPFQERQQ